MAFAVLSVDRVFLGTVPEYVSLIIEIVVGALAYAGTLFTFHRERISTLREMLRALRAGRSEAVSPTSEAGVTGPSTEVVGTGGVSKSPDGAGRPLTEAVGIV
jgi:hypothetical protein